MSSSQRRIGSSTSRLFRSIIIRCPLPWTPCSARTIRSTWHPACSRNAAVAGQEWAKQRGLRLDDRDRDLRERRKPPRRLRLEVQSSDLRLLQLVGETRREDRRSSATAVRPQSSETPRLGSTRNGGPIGSSGDDRLDERRARVGGEPAHRAPAEPVMRIAGPISSSRAAPCSRSMRVRGREVRGQPARPGGELVDARVVRVAASRPLGVEVRGRVRHRPAAEFVISAETSSYGNRPPTGPSTSGWNGARPWPGRSTT